MKEQSEAISLDARVSLPCEVIEFIQKDGEEPRVNVRLSINKRVLPDTKDKETEFIENPEVHEVPILYPSTSKFALTIPIAAGDRGWLLVSDMDIDNWNLESAPETVSARFHDINDAVFMPGGWPRPKFMGGYSDEWVETRNMDSTTRIAMKEGEVHLQALLWSLVLKETGFDVYGAQLISLMDTLILAFEAGAATNAALATETVLTQKAVYGASAAAYLEAVAALTLIKGESAAPERLPEISNRP